MIKGFEQISMSGSTVYSLTLPAGARKAIVNAEVANVRLRMDGTDPTASVGEIIASGSSRELRDDELSAARFIAVSGSPKLNVHYYGANA